MRVARIGLNRLPLTAALSDGHPFKGRRGGSLNRFFAERKGESEAPMYARLLPEPNPMTYGQMAISPYVAKSSGILFRGGVELRGEPRFHLQFFCISAILVL